MNDALSIFASCFNPPGQGSGEGAPFSICIPALTGAADAFLALVLATRADAPRLVLALTPGLPDADRLAEDLKVLTDGKRMGTGPYQTRILEFPPLLTGEKAALGTRLKTIAAVRAWVLSPYPAVVVASYPALAEPIPRGSVPGITLAVDRARGLSLSDLAPKLASIGYRRVPMVETEGDFSVRGGILDAWSPGDEFPVRAEFFGEDLESLRTFDPATQLSVERIASAECLPITDTGDGAGEVEEGRLTLLDILPKGAAVLALDHNAYSLESLLGRTKDGRQQTKAEGLSTFDSRLPRPSSPSRPASTSQLPNSSTSQLLNFSTLIYTGDPAPRGVATYNFQTSPLPGFSELGANEAHHPELFDAARKRLDQHLAAAEKRGDLVLKIDDLSAGFELHNQPTRQPSNQATSNQATYNQSTYNQATNNQATYNQSTYNQATNNQSTNNQSTYNQSTYNQSTNNQSTNNQSTNNQSTNNQSTYNQSTYNQSTNNQSTYNQSTYNQSTYNQSTYNQSTNNQTIKQSNNQTIPQGLLLVSKADRVFTKKKTHFRTNAALNRGAHLTDFDDLEPGEYVVHVDYGVGRYIGSSEIVVDGRRSEVFTIEYADGGKLHVPAAHAHLLSRYVGVKGEAVRLHRLDGKRWEKDKKDAQKAVTDLAAALLETQAKRETVPGFAYDVHCDGREAFDAAFPYEETPDQVSAIAAVEADLAKRKPMDRLICGDAGYGKTEVAMRAAFIAAMNGKQVAVLAPTTVLAEQHFETFTSRFDGTPIRIESVSRFQTGGTHKGTFQRIATGACDIVIGTHAILSSKICFHDLGLIIIDEEQRFGVRHKEFLKSLRATADVLTLSATPIPRTLYLSMTGARDLSLLRSPPRERVAVDTRIVRDSDEVVKTAIESELLRGGQVYFLHNRVMSIGKVEKRLRSLLSQHSTSNLQPDPRHAPRIVVAHGQMDSRTLARKMRDFERGEYDILLSTTIIESGIDIPRANTILVDQADRFGMADLYQLRGRVGRSSRQGYAYFLLPPSGIVDADARERLDALKRHGGLGSGFNLAVRDLELRGAGNLLGAQQSGHIAAVGFGLYCQLLQRTVALMKGEKVKDVIDVQLNLDFAAPRIPYDYIEEDIQRLSLMKRFAEAQDLRIVKALAAEMKDRFGPLPPEAKEYVRIAELRVACATAGLDHVDVKDTRAVFYRAGSREVFKVTDLRGKTTDQKLRELQQQVASFT